MSMNVRLFGIDETRLNSSQPVVVFQDGFVSVSEPESKVVYPLDQFKCFHNQNFLSQFTRPINLTPFLELKSPTSKIPDEEWGFVDFPDFVFGFRPLSPKEMQKQPDPDADYIKIYFRFKKTGKKLSGYQVLDYSRARHVDDTFSSKGLKFYRPHPNHLFILHPLIHAQTSFAITPFFVQPMQGPRETFSEFGNFILCEKNEGRSPRDPKSVRILHNSKRLKEEHQGMLLRDGFTEQDYTQKIKIDDYGLVYAHPEKITFLDRQTDEIFKIRQQARNYRYDFASGRLFFDTPQKQGQSLTLKQIRHLKNRLC